MAVSRIDTFGELYLLTLEQDALTKGERDRILAMGGEDEEERTGQVAIGYEGSGDGAVHANMHVAYASDTATASAIRSSA